MPCEGPNKLEHFVLYRIEHFETLLCSMKIKKGIGVWIDSRLSGR